MHHQRSEADRRSVRVRLTEKGRKLRVTIAELFARHAAAMLRRGTLEVAELDGIGQGLRRTERFWMDQIRYIY
jgi:DNA-binding MarR family transcriptional regulator